MDKIVTYFVSEDGDLNFSHTISDPPGNMDIHMHDFYELYYFLSGDVTYYIEGQVYRIKKNDMMIINNKELHRPKFNSARPYERMVIHFKPEYVAPFITKDYNPLFYLEKRKLGHHNKVEAEEVISSGIGRYFSEMEECIRKSLSETPLVVKTLLLQMLVALNGIYLRKKNIRADLAKYDQRIITIVDYINNNIDKKISLALLEEKFFINKYYLCHLFKETTGFTVIEYLTYKRIMKAKELLAKGYPVLEVCHSVGFGDYSSFYKVLKRLVGKSPKK